MESELSDFELVEYVENMETLCSDEMTDAMLVQGVEKLEQDVVQASTFSSDVIDDVLSLPTPPPLHLSPTTLIEDDVIEISSDSSSCSSDMMDSISSASSEDLIELLLDTLDRLEEEGNTLPQLTYREVMEYFDALPTEDDVIDISSDSCSNLSDVEPD